MNEYEEQKGMSDVGVERDGFSREVPDHDEHRSSSERAGNPEVERSTGEPAPAEVEPTEDLAERYLDQLQRLKAEFDNYRKRIAREKEAWWRESRAAVLSELIPIVDDVSRARAYDERGETPDASGLVLILKRFATTMSKLGLEEMDTAPGTEFDPELHEAVLAVPSKEAEGRIVDTIEPGYLFEGQILRRGKVTVSSGASPE